MTSSLIDEFPVSKPAAFVQALIAAPESEMDFARAKVAVDRFADPSLDGMATLRELDRMVAVVRRMIATLPPEAARLDGERLQALRTFLYEPGWWNEDRPFSYDLTDPFGQRPGSQRLSAYLQSRNGNCVSMPILFAILGERIGLDVTLSTAPLHLFVKWTEHRSGKTYNLETTSGAGFTRDAWYRQKLPMTDEAIANGVYLKKLSRREALAVIATGVLDHLIATRRYDEAIDVADVLLDAYPAHAYALVKKGTAYYRMLEESFIRKNPKENDIPAGERGYAMRLQQGNQEAFDRAEALGWRMPKLEQ